MNKQIREFFGTQYSDWSQALFEAVHKCHGYDESLPDTLGLSRVMASADGENDEANWLAIFKLADGRYAFLSAGCDYTGWDCSASGSLQYAETLAELCRMCLGEDDRQRLGFTVFGRRVREKSETDGGAK